MPCEEITHFPLKEREALFHGRHNLWGSNGLRTHLQCQNPTRRFLLRGELSHEGGVDPGAVLCHVGVGESVARVVPEGERFGRVVNVWGIGGVVTRDGQEGKGHATRLLTHVLSQLESVGHPYVILFCLDHRARFYANRGWQPVTGQSTVEQPPKQTPVPVEAPYHVKYLPLGPEAEQAPLAEIHLWSRPW